MTSSTATSMRGSSGRGCARWRRGRITLRSAWLLVIGLCLVGLSVLLLLPRTAQVIALGSLALVAAYPFMKRITWWPQAWLGLVFSWGALVGWPAVTGDFALPPLLLWLGSVMWVIGYDTLYAIQDVEDDALVGVRSSARALGDRARLGVASATCSHCSAGARRSGRCDRSRSPCWPCFRPRFTWHGRSRAPTRQTARWR